MSSVGTNLSHHGTARVTRRRTEAVDERQNSTLPIGIVDSPSFSIRTRDLGHNVYATSLPSLDRLLLACRRAAISA